MATELTDFEIGEFSICLKDLGGPANEDATIEIVKSKAGLGPALKETDMSDTYNAEIDENDDGEFEEFANGVIDDFNALSEDEQAEALIGLAYENAMQEAAIEDATEVVKALSENSVPREKYDEVVQLAKSAGELIEKMKTTGNAATDDGGLVAEIRKANGGADLSPEAVARIEAIEKAQAETARKDSIAKARTYGFGNAEEVADIEAALRKSNAPLADKFVGIVKQAGGLAKSSPLFKSVGEDAGNADATSPIAKANAAVADIRKAHPNLTEAQAKAKYWDENPDAYAEYRAATRAA